MTTEYMIWELSHMPHFLNLQNIAHLDLNINQYDSHRKQKNKMIVFFNNIESNFIICRYKL